MAEQIENHCIPEYLWDLYFDRRKRWMEDAKPHRYAHLTDDGEWFGKIQVSYIRALCEEQRQRMWLSGIRHVDAIRARFGNAA